MSLKNMFWIMKNFDNNKSGLRSCSNSGSIPGILPNIVHTVKISGWRAHVFYSPEIIYLFSNTWDFDSSDIIYPPYWKSLYPGVSNILNSLGKPSLPPPPPAERDDLQICFVNEIASDDEQLEDDTTALAAQEIARLGLLDISIRKSQKKLPKTEKFCFHDFAAHGTFLIVNGSQKVLLW